MLVCGCVNPPAITDPNYPGIFFTTQDDLPQKARSMAGTPLHIEHCGEMSAVGKVLFSWMFPAVNGSMFALAEIDTSSAPGAVAASYVRSRKLKGFSLGYVSRMSKCHKSGKLRVGEKHIRELSLCKEGAHPECVVLSLHEKPRP